LKRIQLLTGLLVLVLVSLACQRSLPGTTPLPPPNTLPPTLPSATPTRPPSPTVTPTPLPSPTATETPQPSPTATETPLPSPTIEIGETLVGAGDIAICGLSFDDQTAALLESIPGTIFTTGDNSNEDGTLEQYETCFGPNWGRFKERMHPAPGNHDLKGGMDYYTYFGEQAGPPGQGYYSYDLGSWHILSLNSICLYDNSCGPGSPQYDWLMNDLATHPNQCSLAYWHHPFFSSGVHGNNPGIQPLWQLLHIAGVEIVLNGHDHHYERFAPQDAFAQRDEERGIRQFIVGTGGAFLRSLPSERAANSELAMDDHYGVLRLTLYQGRYEWIFVDIHGQILDSGQGNCHP